MQQYSTTTSMFSRTVFVILANSCTRSSSSTLSAVGHPCCPVPVIARTTTGSTTNTQHTRTGNLRMKGFLFVPHLPLSSVACYRKQNPACRRFVYKTLRVFSFHVRPGSRQVARPGMGCVQWVWHRVLLKPYQSGFRGACARRVTEEDGAVSRRGGSAHISISDAGRGNPAGRVCLASRRCGVYGVVRVRRRATEDVSVSVLHSCVGSCNRCRYTGFQRDGVVSQERYVICSRYHTIRLVHHGKQAHIC